MRAINLLFFKLLFISQGTQSAKDTDLLSQFSIELLKFVNVHCRYLRDSDSAVSKRVLQKKRKKEKKEKNGADGEPGRESLQSFAGYKWRQED